ncbi:MAG TPA: substrate-binding domain-containing protein [Beijerinckiaceae bacterium]|nr:substrate-binding domain-containing protein [Beijerinckiaceae bacterium]
MGERMLCRVSVLVFCLLGPVAGAGAETIRVGGTGAVTALIERLAPAFEQASPGDRIVVVPRLGSSGGIRAVSAGALDVAVASRSLTADERASGLNERLFLETPLLFASDTARPLSLTSQDVERIYAGERLSYEDSTLIRLILRPRTDSQNLLLLRTSPGMEVAIGKARLRQDLQVAATDQDNVEIAGATPGAFTAFALTQMRTEPIRLKPVTLNGVEPTLEAMKSGAYPLKVRISWVGKGEAKPAVGRFIAFTGSPEGMAIIEKSGGLPAGQE